MPRTLSPSVRLDPFHNLLDDLIDVELIAKEKRKELKAELQKFRQSSKEASSILDNLKTGKLLLVYSPFTHRVQFGSETTPDSHKATIEEIEFIKKVLYRFKDSETLKLKSKQLRDFISNNLIKAVSSFEFYFTQILRLAYPKGLFESQKKLESIINQDFRKKIEYLKSKQLGFAHIDKRTNKIEEIILTRNLLLHNKGIVNYRYLNKSKVRRAENGEEIPLSLNYLIISSRAMLTFARSVDDSVAKKVFDIKFEPIQDQLE